DTAGVRDCLLIGIDIAVDVDFDGLRGCFYIQEEEQLVQRGGELVAIGAREVVRGDARAVLHPNGQIVRDLSRLPTVARARGFIGSTDRARSGERQQRETEQEGDDGGRAEEGTRHTMIRCMAGVSSIAED